MASVLLVSYPGYPSTPAHLVSNNLLANMAGAAIAAGHDAAIADYGTVSMMRRLFPEQLSETLKPLAARMKAGGGAPDPDQLAGLMQLADRLDEHQAATGRQVAAELAEQAQWLGASLVVLELSDGDGYSGSVTIAEAIRERLPGVHIAGVGRKAAWFREIVLEDAPAFDTIIFGDPEIAVLDLLEVAGGKRSVDSVPGIVHWTASGTAQTERDDATPLDQLAVGIYSPDIYPVMAGDDKIKLAIVTDSRGCPNRCAFCVHPMEDGGRQRRAPAAHIVNTIEAIQRDYGISVFRFGGSSTPGELMHQVAEEILARGLKVEYNSFGHFRSCSPEHFKTIAASGLYSLFFGLESGSQEILDRACHKGIRLEQVEQAVKAAQEAGIFAATSMIVPMPFDTEQTLAESREFITRLRPDAVPLQFPGVFPGTPWIQRPEDYQIEFANPDTYLRESLDYKIKLLFPPQFWQPLPYTINGMRFAEFTAVTMRFAAELEGAGILTNFSHTLAAIARSAGMEPRALRDAAQLWFVTGDAEAMGGMVARANAAIVKG